jgi:hypothetical protein
MVFKSHGLILAVIGFGLAGTAQAQSIPCYSAAQCAQIRVQTQQQQAAREAAYEAQRREYAREQREAARTAAEEARQQAATRAQQAILDQAAAEEAQQRAARYRADAEAREQQIAQDRADAQSRARQEFLEAQERTRLVNENRAAAQLAAENSPDNLCKDHKVAGELLQTFNGFQSVQDSNLQAVDIEHLTTVKFDKDQHVYVCHGAFVLMNGVHRIGTISTKLNVAGTVIANFHADPL